MKLKIKMLPSARKGWKRMLVIMGIYTIWWLAVILTVISLQGITSIIRQYGSANQFFGGLLHSVVKNSLTYYILIFMLALPLVRDKGRKKVFVQYAIFIALLTGYDYLWDYQIGVPTPAIKELSLSFFLISNFILNILMAVVSIFIATWIESNDALKREGDLEKQKLNAELSAIRYQINPHFLFNSLSFIYTKTIRQNPEAAHAVHLLSEIMSYALEEWEDLGRVPLTLELTHMKKVIEMNRIRFNNKLNVDYQERIEQHGDTVLNSAYVPTLVFITLVENAFKHGDLNDEKNKVVIRLTLAEDTIRFSVSNKKKTGTKEPSHGIGLSNVRQRLQLMYGTKQTFVIKEDEQTYLTEININLIKS